MSQRWLHRSQSNATFEFGCLQFAFFFVKLEHKKIDNYLKVILLQAVCRNCSLSINLRLVSVNKTHGTVPLLLSVNNHCPTKQRRIRSLRVNKHFLLLFKYLWSAGGWRLAMWYVIPCFTRQALDWLLAELMEQTGHVPLVIQQSNLHNRQNDPPPRAPTKDVHVLMPRTCGYVIFCGKRDSTCVLELTILRWRDYPGLSGWPQYRDRGPYKRKARGSESWEKIQGWKQRSERKEDESLLSLRWRRVHEPRNIGSVINWKRQWNGFSPGNSSLLDQF